MTFLEVSEGESDVTPALVAQTPEGLRVFFLSHVNSRKEGGTFWFGRVPADNAKLILRGEVLELSRKGRVYAVIPVTEMVLVKVPSNLESSHEEYAIEASGINDRNSPEPVCSEDAYGEPAELFEGLEDEDEDEIFDGWNEIDDDGMSDLNSQD